MFLKISFAYTILFYHVLISLSLIIDLYFLAPAIIAQTFNPIAELVITIEIPAKKTNGDIESHLVIAETIIRECSI